MTDPRCSGFDPAATAACQDCHRRGGTWVLRASDWQPICSFASSSKAWTPTSTGKAVSIGAAAVAVGLFLATAFLLPGGRRRKPRQLGATTQPFPRVAYRRHGSKHEVCRRVGLGSYRPTECVGSCDQAVRRWVDARQELANRSEVEESGPGTARILLPPHTINLAPGLFFGGGPVPESARRAGTGKDAPQAFALVCDVHGLAKASTRAGTRCAVLTRSADDQSCGYLDGPASQVLHPQLLAWAGGLAAEQEAAKRHA